MPTLSLLLAAGLLSIMSIGGCPAAQQPTVPEDNSDAQSQQPPATTPDDQLNQPVVPPNIEDDTTTTDPDTTPPDSTGGSGGGGAGGGGGGDDQGTLVMINIQEPADPFGVRPGTILDIRFDLLDLSGAVESGELLVASDNNADGLPDGASVLPNTPIAIREGVNNLTFDTNRLAGFLSNGFGRFVVGVKATTVDNEVTTVYSPATITVDAVPPTGNWVGAGNPPSIAIDQDDHLVSRDLNWTVRLTTSDNSPHKVRILLDKDTVAQNGSEFELVPETTLAAGTGERTFTASLLAYPSDTYYYYVIITDGIAPTTGFYVANPTSGAETRLAVTRRLIGEFALDQLQYPPTVPSQSKGAILQGFNFNDLAGSSIASVPDLNGDGSYELVIGARFGKPNLASFAGTGWGEAYLIYGNQSERLGGQQSLNSIGSDIPGVTFRGIRTQQNGTHTEGLADITVVEDMDGDELPELAFSFPRVESLSLKSPAPFQHPNLIADISGMGNLEYDAVAMTMGGPVWVDNVAQFTRGGIVLVSSHNQMLTDPEQVTRKFDRVLDLHEVGQMFSWMNRASVGPYILSIDPNDPFISCADCTDETAACGGNPENPAETEYQSWIVTWDVWLGGS